MLIFCFLIFGGTLIVLFLTAIQLKLSTRWVHYEEEN